MIRQIANKILELILSWFGLLRGGNQPEPALGEAPKERVQQRLAVEQASKEEPVDLRGSSGNGATPQLETLLEGLDSPDAVTRAEAATGLAAYPGERVITALEGRLQDNVVEVASAACRSLGHLGSRRSVSALVNVLNNPQGFYHFLARVAAAESLGALGGTEAEAALVSGVDDGGAEVSAACVLALGEISSAAAKQKLSTVAANESQFYAASVVDAARRALDSNP